MLSNQTHFVLLLEYQSNGSFLVHDPFNYTTTYAYDTIHDIIMYTVLSTPQASNFPKTDYPLYKQCNAVCPPSHGSSHY